MDSGCRTSVTHRLFVVFQNFSKKTNLCLFYMRVRTVIVTEDVVELS